MLSNRNKFLCHFVFLAWNSQGNDCTDFSCKLATSDVCMKVPVVFSWAPDWYYNLPETQALPVIFPRVSLFFPFISIDLRTRTIKSWDTCTFVSLKLQHFQLCIFASICAAQIPRANSHLVAIHAVSWLHLQVCHLKNLPHILSEQAALSSLEV